MSVIALINLIALIRVLLPHPTAASIICRVVSGGPQWQQLGDGVGEGTGRQWRWSLDQIMRICQIRIFQLQVTEEGTFLRTYRLLNCKYLYMDSNYRDPQLWRWRWSGRAKRTAAQLHNDKLIVVRGWRTQLWIRKSSPNPCRTNYDWVSLSKWEEVGEAAPKSQSLVAAQVAKLNWDASLKRHTCASWNSCWIPIKSDRLSVPSSTATD